MDAFDRNESYLVILDETLKDLIRYLGQRSVTNLAKKNEAYADKFLKLRLSVKEAEMSVSRDLLDVERCERLFSTIEERRKTAEYALKGIKEWQGNDLAGARRNLDLIQVNE